MQSFLTLESQKQLSEIVLQLSQQPLILQLSQQDLLYKQPAAQAKKTKTVIMMPETTSTRVKSVSHIPFLLLDLHHSGPVYLSILISAPVELCE